MHHDRNILYTVALRSCGEAIHRRGCIAGLQPRAALIPIDKLIRVAQLEFAAAYAVHPYRRVVFYKLMADKLPAHHGDVIGAGVVLAVVEQPCAAREMRVLKPQFLRAPVHALDEELLRAADVLGHGDGAVVCRDDGDALEHIVHAHLLALLKIHAAAAKGRGAGACRHRVVKLQLAALDVLDDEQHCHHLCHARGEYALVRVLLVQHLAGVFLHQYRRRRGDADVAVAQRLGAGGGAEQDGEE